MKSKNIISIFTSFIVVSLLAGCGAKTEIKGLEEKYKAEYGEMFVLPTPEITGSSKDYTWKVVDSKGEEVLDALFGSFYPNIDDYNMTCSVGDVSKSCVLECRDTKGPKVEYYDYKEIVFEGDEIIVPTFTATDISGVKDDATLLIYKDGDVNKKVQLEEGQKKFQSEKGVKSYTFEYSVSDLVGNKTTVQLTSKVREQFIDKDIAENTIFDFDEPDYVNLVTSPSVDATEMPKFAIVNGAVEGMNKGAIKLEIAEPNKYFGVSFVRGHAISTAVCYTICFRIYASEEISLFTIQSKKETLAPISFSNIEAKKWVDLKFSARQLSPDNIDLNSFEIRFNSQVKCDLYIDEIYGIPLSEDKDLKEHYIASFDKDLYYNNIEQAGYEIGNGQITAEYKIVQKQDMPTEAIPGTNGGALRVKVNDIWVADYAGYGVLGDGVKYNLLKPFNTSELKNGGILTIKFFCETGDGLALSFTYKNPVTGALLRSKARWVRGIEKQWVSVKLDYQLITQIVPYSPISKKEGGQYEDFDITAIVMTTCGNVPVDEADTKKGFRTPCELFYIDSIKLTKENFVDKNIKEGLLADFDEEGYEDQINQAWTYVAVSSEIVLKTEGDPDLPADTHGGAVWCKAHYIDDVVYPYQGARGDGIRYILPQPIKACDIDEVSYRIYSVTGTACYIGYVVIDKDGNRVQRQGFWENADNGEKQWSTIVQPQTRLSIRLQPDDQVIAMLVYARGDGLDGKQSLSEFFLDEIGIKTSKSFAWNGGIVKQSTDGWEGSSRGGATMNVLSYEDRETKNLLSMYPYSGASKEKVPNFLAGINEGDCLLEVVSRHSPTVNYCDGAKITFNEKLEFNDNTKLEINMYTTTNTHGGYGFYIRDAKGTMYQWRIKTTDYNGAYSWTKLSLDLSILKEAGLDEITSIDLVAVGSSLDTNLTCTYAAYKEIKLVK